MNQTNCFVAGEAGQGHNRDIGDEPGEMGVGNMPYLWWCAKAISCGNESMQAEKNDACRNLQLASQDALSN